MAIDVNLTLQKLSQRYRIVKAQMERSKSPHVYLSSVNAAKKELEIFKLELKNKAKT
jgi:hypothetical protein